MTIRISTPTLRLLRSLSYRCPVQVRHYAVRAPKVRAQERARRTERNGKQPPITNSAKDGPTDLDALETHIRDTLRSEPSRSVKSQSMIDMFRAFPTWYRSDRSAGAIQDFLHAHTLEPISLYILATALITTPHTTQRLASVAESLLWAGSKVDNVSASLTLFARGLNREELDQPKYRDVVVRVAQLAENGNAAAMAFTAKKCEIDGELDNAIDLASMSRLKGAQGGVGAQDGAFPLSVPIPDTWNIIARVKSRKGDLVGQQIALEQGAFEDQDANAYYELADKCFTPSAEEYIRYMLKAATSGLPSAAVRVGQWYFIRAEGKPREREGQIDSYALAQQWFSVALASSDRMQISEQVVQLYTLVCLAAQGNNEACQRQLITTWRNERWAQEALSQLGDDTLDTDGLFQEIRVQLQNHRDHRQFEDKLRQSAG